MQLGIFAKTFAYPTLDEVLDAVAAYGLTHVQFNMSCVGLPTLPERIPNDLCTRIAEALRELLEGKFVDALRTVAAEMTMEELHEKRGEPEGHEPEAWAGHGPSVRSDDSPCRHPTGSIEPSMA